MDSRSPRYSKPGGRRHGYENGYRTLGRQALLEPIEWMPDGWFRARGGDLSHPLPAPRGGKAGPAGIALSDDFATDRIGTQWAFHAPGPDEMRRVHYGKNSLRLAGTGSSPADSSPLTCIVGDHDYQAEVTLELDDAGEGGLLLFYNGKAFVGLGFTPTGLRVFQYAEEQAWARQSMAIRRVRIRLTNETNVVTYHYSRDEGRTWTRLDTRMEVSGIHHNVFGGFLSLRIGFYSAGKGSVVLSNFTYSAFT